MPFELSGDVEVTRDKGEMVRALDHLRQPFFAAEGRASDLVELADAYLAEVAPIYRIGSEQLRWLDRGADDTRKLPPDPNVPDRLVRSVIAPLPDGSGVVAYAQQHANLDVWEAGVAVTTLAAPLRVVSSRSTFHHGITLANSDVLAGKPPRQLTATRLASAVGLRGRQRLVRIHDTRLLVYQYDPRDPNVIGNRPRTQTVGAAGPTARLDVPPVPDSIVEGDHYVVIEALFAAPAPGLGEINWRTFVEPQTGAVLYLQAGSADCTAQVYLQDAPTAGSAATALAASATLDPLRSTVTLHDLTPSDPQQLTGTNVTIAARGATAAPPTRPASSCDFTGSAFSVPSTNFAATNCYHHLDELYRLMTTWGFNPITTLFPQTTFPVTAYYLDEAPGVNAHANGNAGFTALTNYTFGVETTGSTVGFAVDWRFVMHEFNHHILYDRVHSPNYGFAHNGGDGFAVVWMDPDSSAPDRGLSFPWCPEIPRRHDRPVNGWAWGGSNDDRGYLSEQILSTCLMRIYLSAGGAATDATTRRLASRHVCFLKVHADVRLGPSPIVSSTDPRTYVTALQNADVANNSPDGIPGGTLGKVFRWAFEKQGLYQPAGAPTPVTTPGVAPAIDVYIDDGRGGEYAYIGDFWDNTEVWSRRHPDGVTNHEEPILRQPNFAYVRVRNRGTATATGVVVRGYHARPSAGLSWPDDWAPMTTSQLPASDITSGGSVVVGPFTWVPTEAGHECMLMEVSCPGDRSNIDVAGALPCAFGPTPHWRLIPFDNNLAQRNVAPVAAGAGAAGLIASFHQRRFWVNNPYDRTVRIDLHAELPPLLAERGWKLGFSGGGATFTLGPRANRQIGLVVNEGRQFTVDDVKAVGDPLLIKVRTLIEGAIVGGMSYVLDPDLKRPSAGRPTGQRRRLRLHDTAEELLRDLDFGDHEVTSVEVTHIIVDITLRQTDDDGTETPDPD